MIIFFPCLFNVFKVFLRSEMVWKRLLWPFLFDLCLFNLLTKVCFKLQSGSHWWKPCSQVLLPVPVIDLYLKPKV